MDYAPLMTEPRRRRPATPEEAKALGHPLRLRIMRMCLVEELTNKQLADRLDRDPGTVLHHVRQLVSAGLLEPAPVRTGASGALEKPYKSNNETWWLDGPLADADAETRFAPIEIFQEEIRAAGPESVAVHEKFLLHLSPDEVGELDRRILAVLDEYVATDHERLDRPALGGIFVLHHVTREAPDEKP